MGAIYRYGVCAGLTLALAQNALGCGYIGYEYVTRGGDASATPGNASDSAPQSEALTDGDPASQPGASGASTSLAPPWCLADVCVPGNNAFESFALLPATVTTEDAACVIDAAGQLLCWGSNRDGQLGRGYVGGEALAAAPVSGLTDVAGYSGSSDMHCAWQRDGAVFCWGIDDSGDMRLGTGATGGASAPQRVANLPPARRVATSADGACAITTEGGLYCWGDAIPRVHPERESLYPVQVNDASFKVNAIFGNAGHRQRLCFAHASDNRLYCWGPDADSLVGADNRGEDVDSPTPIVGAPRFVTLSLGAGYTCGLAEDGVAWCWGDQVVALGRGALSDGFYRPEPVAGNIRFKSLAAGHNVACALSIDNAVYCWGGHGHGLVPTLNVDFPDQVVALTGNDHHWFALDASGTLYGYGADDGGVLGNDDPDRRVWNTLPVQGVGNLASNLP